MMPWNTDPPYPYDNLWQLREENQALSAKVEEHKEAAAHFEMDAKYWGGKAKALTAEVERLKWHNDKLREGIHKWAKRGHEYVRMHEEYYRLKRIEAAAKGMSDSFCEGCGREPLCGDGTYDAVCMGADLKQALEGGRDDA
jgi:hypothetical protein